MTKRSTRTVFNKWSRKLHRWGAIITAVPVVIVICTGLLLQWKKQNDSFGHWIQPRTVAGSTNDLTLSFDEILAITMTEPRAAVTSWADIDRLDVRPSKGVIKVRCNNRWELQLDSTTGEILQVEFRRSDLIESIHDGSFFHDKVKIWVFFPSAIILLGLWISGIYLWLLPILAKRKGRLKRAAQRAHSTPQPM